MEEIFSTFEVYELLDLCVAKLKSKYFVSYLDLHDKIVDPDAIHFVLMLSKLSVELKHRCDLPF